MITNATTKDYYYKSDIDFYADTLAELEALDRTNIAHASKAYIISTGETKILSGSGEWKPFSSGSGGGGGGNAGNIFFINQDSEDGSRYVLNATWQQIYDNFVQNIPSFYYTITTYSEGQQISMGIFTSVNKIAEDEIYRVEGIDSNGNMPPFETLSSPDDHPFYIFEF